jgi:hypothetical protein
MDSTWKKINNINDLLILGGGDIFLARWNGRICIAQFNPEDKSLYACFNPAQLGPIKISQDKFDKFDYLRRTSGLEVIEIDREQSCEYCNNNEININKCSLSNHSNCHQNNDNQSCSNFKFYNKCKRNCPKIT